MAIIKRRRVFAIGGLVEDNPLASGATTLTSAGLAALPALATDEYFPVVLDPDGIAGAPEVAYLTAHTAGATTATISKAGYEGTTARAHDRDTVWDHTPTHMDYDGQDGGSGLIGIKTYNPGSDTLVSTTSSSHADIDATNIVVSFTAPPSGTILLRFTAYVGLAPSCALSWNLRDGGGDIANTASRCAYQGDQSVAKAWTKAGLTPGTLYTYKIGHARILGAATAETRYGGQYGPAILEVFAVNL